MIAALLFVTCLLLVGVALRIRFGIFQWLYIPASVIAGMLGLAVIQLAPASVGSTTTAIAATLSDWPNLLIAVVFAGMLLERKPAEHRENASNVGREALMVWIIVLGQTACGLLATWIFIQPFYDLPNSFGMLIETGFAGGHGTAAAMGEVFAHESIALAGGRDLGILMATVGLVYGVVSGIGWINLGARRGWFPTNRLDNLDKDTPRLDSVTSDAASPPPRVPIGYATIRGETLDPLLLQALWLMAAFGIGMAMQQAVLMAAAAADGWFASDTLRDAANQQLSTRLSFSRILDFPLFIYTLFGGLIVRRCTRMLGCEDRIDSDSIGRISSAAMDVLVVAAIASLNIAAVATMIVPFSILAVVGAIWTGVCLLVISRWVLPRDHWFELGLINYGMSTGVTATGFVLLRLVDPDLDSDAAENYALAAPLSAPFVGGGMLTIGLPLLVLERVPLGITSLVAVGIVIAMIVVGRRWQQTATV
tara:strand:- start:15178 stop:16614 length:1437 start_codon:yes stop_codon:yes gene_type:complete